MNYKHKQAIMVKGFKELGWPIEEAKVPHTTFYLWLPIPKNTHLHLISVPMY